MQYTTKGQYRKQLEKIEKEFIVLCEEQRTSMKQLNVIKKKQATFMRSIEKLFKMI